MAYRTGRRIVEMVNEDLKPSDILTRKSFLNAIVANSAIGGSTNAPIHLAAIARHVGVELSLDDWQTYGHKVPLLVDMQPAGRFLGEDFHRAGGIPAVLATLLEQGLIHGQEKTVSGLTVEENIRDARILSTEVIRPFTDPLKEEAGFLVLRGNLFDTAIMKTSVIGETFRERYLQNPKDPNAFEGRAIVFDGPEDYHHRIDDESLAITEQDILVMRGTGPIGYPGAAEVVNMRPPNYLIRQGVLTLPCIGDGRQSGTSASPSILHVSPEAAVGGNLAILQTGDRLRIDLVARRVDVLISDDEIAQRHAALVAAGGYAFPPSQTPWQAMHRSNVGGLDTGMVLEQATSFQKVSQTMGLPRDNH